uniref:Uncharacterized protein n=1 Tax=Equus asinus TaxID=9793 RepID=A0A9L0KDZ4_EQUAS
MGTNNRISLRNCLHRLNSESWFVSCGFVESSGKKHQANCELQVAELQSPETSLIFRGLAPTVSPSAESGNTYSSKLPAAPWVPFDNTACRNLQRHEYTTPTSLDLSKFRMLQPSSGRVTSTLRAHSLKIKLRLSLLPSCLQK